MSYDIIGAVEQARDVACIAYVHHGRKALLRKVSLDIVALVGSSRCHKLQQHSWESALHAHDTKKLLRAHTDNICQHVIFLYFCKHQLDAERKDTQNGSGNLS